MSKRLQLAAGVMVVALGVLAIVASSGGASAPSVMSVKQVAAQQALRTKLYEGPVSLQEDEAAPAAAEGDAAPAADPAAEPAADAAAPAADDAAAPRTAAPAEESFADKAKKANKNFMTAVVPHFNRIHWPSSFSDVRQIFGMHLDWTLFVIFCAILTFGYVRYVRPHMVKSEDEEMMLDENDVTQNLLLIPGEEIFFHSEEPGVSSMMEMLMCGCGNRVHKLGVTTKRIVAQKRESTAFGTCQLTAREDCWPIENVNKVSVISGEFWGYTVPVLWDMACKYFTTALLFDFLHSFVHANLIEFFGNKADDEVVSRVISAINMSLYVLCNVLFLLALIYSFGVMSLVIWPHSLVKVYLTKEMEEEGNPLSAACGCCSSKPNSRPMESFTFQTVNSYKAYQAIMAARSGASLPAYTKALHAQAASTAKPAADE